MLPTYLLLCFPFFITNNTVAFLSSKTSYTMRAKTTTNTCVLLYTQAQYVLFVKFIDVRQVLPYFYLFPIPIDIKYLQYERKAILIINKVNIFDLILANCIYINLEINYQARTNFIEYVKKNVLYIFQILIF